VLVVGDHDAGVTAHRANPHALALSGAAAGCEVQGDWPGTKALARGGVQVAGYDGVWCVPASPYADTEGALRAIREAREAGIPLLGTCGGFQHAILEYARNVLGLRDAEHEELEPGASEPLISRLSCSMVEVRGDIDVAVDSMAGALLATSVITEEYHCNFGLDARREPLFEGSGLRFVGRDAAGEPRIAELRGHPFYLLTLFQPERAALRGVAHPLITGFVRASLLRSVEAQGGTG
jgi:CTP synthase (UTP-ammonia lyase)